MATNGTYTRALAHGAFSGILIALALLALAADADAVVTAQWTVDTYEQLDEGEGTSAIITSEGDVKPGWATQRTTLEVNSTWAAVRMPGGSIVVGTDGDGAIYELSAGKATKIATIRDAVAIVSLAVARDGTLYAGTMPGGAIWTIAPRTHTTRKLVVLPETETVWALALSADGASLYAGTGPHGTLFRVSLPSGKATVAFATEDQRVLAVTATADGAIWLGTSDKAIVFRYDPQRGAARAMADFDGNEITALAATRAGVVAAANKFKPVSGGGPRPADAVAKGSKRDRRAKGEPIRLAKAGTKPGADKATPPSARLPRPGARKGTGAIYRIEDDGSIEQLHSLSATYFTSLAVDRHGRVFAGAGDKGRVYLIGIDDSVATAFDVPERQVAQVIADERGVAFTTADGAAFYRSTRRARRAVYRSKVNDTGATSKLGRIVWRGDGRLEIETRSGNTAEPGVGWSRWSPPRQRARAGGHAWTGRITSPPGRYVQFRVIFGGDRDDSLHAVALYHLPQNRPTKVTKITFDHKDDKIDTTATAPAPRSPILKLEWTVDNPDGDTTVYHLSVRREGEIRWRPLRTTDGKPITETKFEWNTETFPDGYYELRVTASDAPSNADRRALRSHRITPLFVVDNDKPAINGVSIHYPQVSAHAADTISAIAQAAYSVDDGPWQLAGTSDELFDNLSEMLSFELPATLSPGTHTLAIRAADEAGNIGSAAVTFRVR